jgi:cell division protein FtsZ
MSINIGPPSVEELRPRITVIGVGGAGGNAIANMIQADIEGVDFVVANTDAQALNNSVAEHRIQLGPDITQGLGAGSRPEVGRAAAEETVAEIERALEGVNMVFIAAGMGGGTGTGAAPVPVPPPIPAAMKTMLTPSSARSISWTVSSAAARPTSGRDPAPSP